MVIKAILVVAKEMSHTIPKCMVRHHQVTFTKQYESYVGKMKAKWGSSIYLSNNIHIYNNS